MPNLEASYVTSAPNIDACPPSTLPEFAFIGRSNVGKSSLINLLANRKNLALVSNKPGKTKMGLEIYYIGSWN